MKSLQAFILLSDSEKFTVGYYLIIRQGEVYRLLSHYQTGRSLQAIISLSDREKFTGYYLIIRQGEVYRLLSHY